MTDIRMVCADSTKLDPASFEFDVMITDPPYSEHVHSSATSQSAGGGTRKRDLGFESLTVASRRSIAQFSTKARRWSVVYSDLESANWLALAAQAAGAEYVRFMLWERWSMPQLSGDRPPQGCEALIVLHRADALTKTGKLRKTIKPIAKHWNGPGHITGFHELALRDDDKYKAEKPLDQALRLVSYFSDLGELVFDPFMGSGTTAQACRILGRRFVGLELNQQVKDMAQERVTGYDLNSRDRERLQRFINEPNEPVAQQAAGPSVGRAESRKADRERAAKFLEGYRL